MSSSCFPFVNTGRAKLKTCGSQLTAYNIKRKQDGENEVNENDPSMYAMENKSAWRIDGAKWKEVVALASSLLVIRGIMFEKMTAYIQHHPTSKNSMQSLKIFKKWMLEWASNLTLTYKQPEMKGQLDCCLRCLEATKACNVDMALAPEVLKEYLKEHYLPFYSFHFADDTQSESGKGSDEETEGEAEFDEGSAAGLYLFLAEYWMKITNKTFITPNLYFVAQGYLTSKANLRGAHKSQGEIWT